ncbi:efflux RND transporter periplasmic adaptor subunit [Rhodoferax sp.]|uniref:efflux RND transporter periplasmic adaptor subunit n=1 Tax=Rhodoferax sp. TaxID=50421 RepID=UPI00277A3DD6|nr:efflux RND transporter periplasmic adaptor subunit [Rhodoferax sp.]
MRTFLSTRGRTLALASVLILLAALLGYVALRAGPLAPVPVTLVTVDSQPIKPALFGIGTVEARFTHKIGPTFAGRIKRVEVQPGDHVTKGQLLGEMDPVDLDDKIGAQEATIKRAEASALAVDAQVQEVSARKAFAEVQAKRYEQLLSARSVSEEGAQAKRQELQIAQASLSAVRANLDASRQELIRARADRDGLMRQRANLRLVSPVDGLVTRRDVDPGTTAVAGQAVVEVVEPASIWISVRFDQQRANGLTARLPAQIVLRSRAGELLAGRVSRIEPHADAVTEEIRAKVEFTQAPKTPPPIGELAEVTVALAAQKAMPVVPNASVQRVDGRLGVWLVEDGSLRFAPVKTGASDLEGRVQILQGLSGGERVVVYSQKALAASTRIKVVARIVGKAS